MEGYKGAFLKALECRVSLVLILVIMDNIVWIGNAPVYYTNSRFHLCYAYSGHGYSDIWTYYSSPYIAGKLQENVRNFDSKIQRKY